MATPAAGVHAREADRPWFREVTADQWRAFLAAYLGWMLDGFDFSVVTFLLVDIQRSFTVNSALAGALGSVALVFRVVGGVGRDFLWDANRRRVRGTVSRMGRRRRMCRRRCRRSVLTTLAGERRR